MSPLFALALCLAAPPAPAGNDAQLVKDWLRVCKAHADDYVISPADKPDEKFKMLTDPVFRHTQPVRGDDIGAVWLWVQEDGRPAAIGTVFAYSSGVGAGGYRFVVHEFHSMLDRPLVAMWRGKPQWSTDRAGLEWNPVPGAPVPTDSTVQRARQMGELAREYRGHEIDAKGGRWELRLIPKPVYRYELKKKEAVLDGAVFVFCQGTDPEIIFSIEARSTSVGYRWHYAWRFVLRL